MRFIFVHVQAYEYILTPKISQITVCCFLYPINSDRFHRWDSNMLEKKKQNEMEQQWNRNNNGTETELGNHTK